MTPVTLPDRSLTQRRDALATANVIRSYRSDLKRDIKAGRKHVLEMLVNPPQELLSMKVAELVLATPGVGRVKVNKWMNRSQIAGHKTIGGMTRRQRLELARLLASQRVVGHCSSCGGPLVRLAQPGEFASCDCGESSIPEAVLSRRMAA
jgi:hypothetical protein